MTLVLERAVIICADAATAEDPKGRGRAGAAELRFKIYKPTWEPQSEPFACSWLAGSEDPAGIRALC